MSETILELRNLGRSFKQGGGVLDVLTGVDFTLNPGELVALVAPSGTGKSTLLHLAGLLDTPTQGEIVVGGKAAVALSDAARTALRRQKIGFVYQYHHLLPEFSALENIVLPQMIAGQSRKKAEARAKQLLEQVGLAKRADHRPGQLSGGEQQRVAIARALANHPAMLIADEPTGNLDPHTADGVFEILRQLTRSEHLAVLVATHNLDLARRMDRIVTLQEGKLVAA